MRRNKSRWLLAVAGIAMFCLALGVPGQAGADNAKDTTPKSTSALSDVKAEAVVPAPIPAKPLPPPKDAAAPTPTPVPALTVAAAAQSRHTIYQYMPDASSSLTTESRLSEISKEIAGKVFYELKAAGPQQLTARIAVVAAVPLSDLKRETEFGRLIAEYNLTDLSDRGLRVKELRLGKDINILPQTGEFILSRNIGEIANDSPALDYVVVSTFTNTRKTLILQGRLVSLKTGLVKTSWRYSLPLNRALLSLLYSGDREPFVIAVKGIGQQ